jgi:hypothetical protein
LNKVKERGKALEELQRIPLGSATKEPTSTSYGELPRTERDVPSEEEKHQRQRDEDPAPRPPRLAVAEGGTLPISSANTEHRGGRAPKKALNLLTAAIDLTKGTPKPHHRYCHRTDSPLSPQPKAAPPRRRTTQCAIVARPKPEFSPGKKRKGGGLPHQPFKKENGDRIVAADVAGTDPAKSFPRQLPTELART